MFPTLFYGSLIWMTDSNMTEIERLWGKIAKTAVGAIFNVNHCILEVILGVVPLQIQNQMIKLKHFLKAITVESGSDNYLEFIRLESEEGNSAVTSTVRLVFKFLEWKMDHAR